MQHLPVGGSHSTSNIIQAQYWQQPSTGWAQPGTVQQAAPMAQAPNYAVQAPNYIQPQGSEFHTGLLQALDSFGSLLATVAIASTAITLFRLYKHFHNQGGHPLKWTTTGIFALVSIASYWISGLIMG